MNGHNRAAVLGLDLGTSGVRVVVTSLDGDVLGRSVAGYPVRVPAPGQAESDPRDWWSAVRRAVHTALGEASDTRLPVTGLAVAGQMHGLVLTDECGAALRPAIIWLDQRATAEAALYRELPGDYTAPLRNHPAPGLAGPLLCWLAAHEPNTLRCAWWVLQPKDWIRFRLTGRAATDPTDASGTLLFDLARDAWAAPLIGKLGLSRDKLPPLVPSAAPAGRLLPGPAAELGLDPGIPVATGAGDTPAALLAAGLRPDDALLGLGRDGHWVVPVPRLAAGDPLWPGCCEPDPRTASRPATLYRAVGDGYCRLVPVTNVGITLDQVRGRYGATWQELYDTAARPRTAGREPEDQLRGALDEAADLLRQGLDDLRAAGHAPRRVVLGGGGTAHPAWRDLLAETLGLPLVPAPAAWLAPAGAARLAAAAAASAA